MSTGLPKSFVVSGGRVGGRGYCCGHSHWSPMCSVSEDLAFTMPCSAATPRALLPMSTNASSAVKGTKRHCCAAISELLLDSEGQLLQHVMRQSPCC